MLLLTSVAFSECMNVQNLIIELLLTVQLIALLYDAVWQLERNRSRHVFGTQTVIH